MLTAGWIVVFGLTFLTVSAQLERPLRVVVAVQPPFVEKVTNGASTEFRGYCIDMLDKLKEIIGFTYDIYEVRDKSYGRINDYGEWNGVIAELVAGDADMAVAALHVTAERENFIDFTVPFYDLVGSTIMMKKWVDPLNQRNNIFKMFQVIECKTWGYIVVAYFATCIFIWIYDRIAACFWARKHDKASVTCGRVCYLILGPFTPPGRSIGMRLIGAVWWATALIIISCVAAYLTQVQGSSYRRVSTPISSIDDLARQYKIKYSTTRNTITENYFKRSAEIEERIYDMVNNPRMTPQERSMLVGGYISDKYTNMWRYMQENGMMNSTQEAIQRVLASPSPIEGYAYIGDATTIRFAELTNCQLQQVGEEFYRTPYAIAVQQGSPLKDQISSGILKLLNQRELEHLKEIWWNQHPDKAECPQTDDGSETDKLYGMLGLFVLIGGAILISIVILLFDCCCAKSIGNSYSTSGSQRSVHVGYANQGYGK